MKIDNFNQIIKYIDNKDKQSTTFFLVQIIQRSKDNPSLSKNKVIISFWISDSAKLKSQKKDIIAFCEAFNARCYFFVNKRDSTNIASLLSKKCIDIITSNEYVNINRELNSITASNHSEPRLNQRYIIDIDTKDDEIINKYEDLLDKTYEERKRKIDYFILNTINGVHIIANVFDLKLFYTYCDVEKIEKPTVFTDNCTLLYA